jgi:hypothetical protein
MADEPGAESESQELPAAASATDRLRFVKSLPLAASEIKNERVSHQASSSSCPSASDHGAIRLRDGREFAAPSRAPQGAAGGGFFDGWKC